MFKTLITVPDTTLFSCISPGECFFMNDKPYVKGNLNNNGVWNSCGFGLGHPDTVLVGMNVMVTRAVCSGSIRPATIRMLGINKEKEQKQETVRIVGSGCEEEASCVLSGTRSTGFIEINCEQLPCNLSILGKGVVGAYVSVPSQYVDKLRSLRKNYY